MSTEIKWKKQALKFLNKQNLQAKKRIIQAIYALPEGDTKNLVGHAPYKRLRVGAYRIIYTEDGIVYTIEKIDNRGDVYKRIK